MHLIYGESKFSLSNYCRFKRIKITDPEQFVPLYVATMFPGLSSMTRSHYYIGGMNPIGYGFDLHIVQKTTQNINKVYTSYGSTARPNHISVIQEAVKQDLLEYLDQPTVTEYSLLTWKEMRSGVNPTSSFIKNFSGDLIKSQDTQEDEYAISCLGFFGKRDYSKFTTLDSVLYKSTTQTSIDPNLIIPELLIVIKAKHLKAVRARLYLSLPWNVPISDIKLLRASTAGNTAYGKGILSFISNWVKEQQINVEYTSPEEIRKYLVASDTTTRTAKECLQSARKLVASGTTAYDLAL